MADLAMPIPLTDNIRLKAAFPVFSLNQLKANFRVNLDKHAEFRSIMCNNPGIVSRFLEFTNLNKLVDYTREKIGRS